MYDTYVSAFWHMSDHHFQVVTDPLVGSMKPFCPQPCILFPSALPVTPAAGKLSGQGPPIYIPYWVLAGNGNGRRDIRFQEVHCCILQIDAVGFIFSWFTIYSNHM